MTVRYEPACTSALLITRGRWGNGVGDRRWVDGDLRSTTLGKPLSRQRMQGILEREREKERERGRERPRENETGAS